MATTKKARTVLCLGPPHSGKSVFSYILFKFLRANGNNACVMDCDYYSPTYRRFRIVEFAAPNEVDHIYSTSNAKKLTKLKEENFCRVAQGIYDLIEHNGVIVLDGIGRHSLSTECLLKLAKRLVVLCPASFNVKTDSKASGYIKGGKELHPFSFYGGKLPGCMKITTHYHNVPRASFDQKKLEGELFDLDIKTISKGRIDKIPERSRDTILQIAKFVLDFWI